MSRVPRQLQFETAPVADPKAIVTAGHARFSVLTPLCVRMEWSADGTFEDRASQVFWFREQGVPAYKARKTAKGLTLKTPSMTITYEDSPDGFSKDSLTVMLNGTKTVWHPGDKDTGNLLGTCRTLDGANGTRGLEPGLMSRSGLTVVDDTRSLVFNDQCWLQARGSSPEAYQDLYAFGHGTDYQQCLREYTAVAGPVPLIPRWALGNWWSRYWAYTDTELTDLMNEFRSRDVPLSVCIIDMDWHVVQNPHTNGWTGYSWSKEHFANPRAFLKQIHDDLNLKVALNLHPHDGVHPHEDAYSQVAEHMGVNPKSTKPIAFDIADPKFTDAYFRYLHAPHEKMGVDFWWMDWQQGSGSSLEGLDPLYWLNHLHALDLARDGTRRPFVFSRWPGLGGHRYQIGFSGDTVVNWESLAFQPYFTATASNVGYTWWSHDIGGHFFGTETPELYTRWVQYGVFSPILRLHSCKNKFQSRVPWEKGLGPYEIGKRAFQLRHALIPYLYSMNQLTYQESVPLVRPMYWTHPKHDEAYQFPRQYWFGTELIAAPFVTPIDHTTNLSRQVVWLPKGDWYDYFDGTWYPGSRVHAVYGTLRDTPVFARAGAIVPLSNEAPSSDTGNPAHMKLRVFAGADNTFSLYEDDGETTAHRNGESATTAIRLSSGKTSLSLTIAAPKGSLNVLPESRAWTVEFVNVADGAVAKATLGGKVLKVTTTYNARRGTLTVSLPSRPVDAAVRIQVRGSKAGLLRNDFCKPERIFRALRYFELNNESKSWAYHYLVEKKSSLADVRDNTLALTESQKQCLFELHYEAGIDLAKTIGPETRRIVAWNNHARKDISLHAVKGHANRPVTLAQVPRIQIIPFGHNAWNRGLDMVTNAPWKCALQYGDAGSVVLESDV